MPKDHAAGAESDRLKSVQVATGAAVGVLMMVPGCNGDGRGMLNEAGPWARFADEAHLVLVGPTFKTTLEEVHSRQSYYYPELWSGAATLKAMEQIRAEKGGPSCEIFFFPKSISSNTGELDDLVKGQN